MAVTRIKNNQITDGTIVGSSKIADYSITGAKLGNTLTYGSDLTVSGNLTVNGEVTAIDTIDMTVEDPLILLAKEQTGTPALDIGFIGKRGSGTNIAWVWDESESEFATAFTSDEVTNTTITISSYANFKTQDADVLGNLQVTGSIDIDTAATVASLKVEDLTDNRVVIAGTGGEVEDDANFTFDGTNLAVGGVFDVTVSSGDTVVGDLTGTTVDVTGNVDGGNLNSDALISATTSITAGTTITATGNVAGGNVTTGGKVDATGDITGANFITAGDVEAATGTITTLDGTTADFSGNVDGGNLNSDAGVYATTAITAGTTITATGNIDGGNLNTGGAVVATGDVSGATIISTAFQGASPTISSTDTNGDITLDPNGTGTVDVASSRITGVSTPSGDTDAANKAYVDSVAEGLDIKESCVAATTGALPAVTYNNGASGVGATLTADANGALAAVDGVTLTATQRVLIKDQVAELQNGIYIVTTVGDGSTAFVLTRAGDMDGSPASEIPGAFTFIEEGSTYADTGWVCTTNAPVTMGSTAITWSQFSGAGQITAGDGLSKNGDTLSVNVDDSTIEINADTLRIKANAPLTTPDIGAATGTSLDASGNVDGGNLNSDALISAATSITAGTTITATGNITGANFITAGDIEAATGTITTLDGTTADFSGNVDGGNLNSDAAVIAVGDITGANFITAGDVEAATGTITTLDGTTADFSGNVDGGNLNSDALISAATSITAGTTITATGNLIGGGATVTGDTTLGNWVFSSSDVTRNAAGELTVNDAGIDVDFRIEGDNDASLFITNAGDDTVNIGTATSTAGAKLKVGTTDSIMIPVGTTGERPGSAATGMIRFNTTLDNLEFYDSSSWTTAGTTFTVITANTQSGDGSTTAFTLPESGTTAGTIVSINGVVQIPTSAYSVSGSTCTFTEAPLSTDSIDFRQLATTTEVIGIANGTSDVTIPTADGAIVASVAGAEVTNTAAGAFEIKAQGELRLADTDSSNYVALKAPGTVASNISFTIPGTDGTSGQALVTDGSGTLSFGAAGATITSDTTTNAERLIYVGSLTSGALTAVTQDSGFTYNPSNGTITATAFSGAVSGDQSGITGTGALNSGSITSGFGSINIGTDSVTLGSIANANSDGVGNIGASGASFNTVHAKATSAQYADLAEMYSADADLEAGTVVMFGGDEEVTECGDDHCAKVAGVVSTNPSYTMNAAHEGDHVVAVALTGRVPTKVTGAVAKGDMMVSAGNGMARAEAAPAMGTVIGKALEDHAGGDGTIEVVVGRV